MKGKSTTRKAPNSIYAADRRIDPRIPLPAGTKVSLRVKTLEGVRTIEGEMVDMSRQGLAVKVDDRPENYFGPGSPCQVVVNTSGLADDSPFVEQLVRRTVNGDGTITYGIVERG